jgi:hypothetical protein
MMLAATLLLVVLLLLCVMQVETMPGQRCIFDGILLPNGHVVLIGGQKVKPGITRSCCVNDGSLYNAACWHGMQGKHHLLPLAASHGRRCMCRVLFARCAFQQTHPHLCFNVLTQVLLLLQVGLGDLTDTPAYNGGHQPYNEPWVSATAATATCRTAAVPWAG